MNGYNSDGSVGRSLLNSTVQRVESVGRDNEYLKSQEQQGTEHCRKDGTIDVGESSQVYSRLLNRAGIM